jgi:hypothetical protein
MSSLTLVVSFRLVPGRPAGSPLSGCQKIGPDVILRSEATKNLFSVPVSQSQNSRSFAPLRMTK